jgi:putative protease
MKFNSFVTSSADIRACAEAPQLEEVLIEPRELSREGRLSFEEAEKLAREAREHNLKPVLVWDILMTQNEFKTKCARVSSIDTTLFSSIRTQCSGAASWVRENLPDKGLQIILENSNHNLPGLKRWVSHLAPQRLILSTQIPEERLLECCRELQAECEILGAGKILLFYSKRSLLAANFNDTEATTDNRWIYTDSSSEESASRPFPTVENTHGTFMYLNKDHFILDQLEKLSAGGIHTVRIDLRDLQGGEHSSQGIAELCRTTLACDLSALNAVWSRPTAAPFFKRNRTDKQLTRMKPLTRLLRDSNCLAEVVSVERGEELGLFTLRDFSTEEKSFTFVAADGRQIPVDIEGFNDFSGSNLTRCIAHKLVRCRWFKGISAGALLMRSGASSETAEN